MTQDEKQNEKPSRFKLLETLQEGVYGKVYRAQDAKEGKSLLVKVIPKAVSQNPQFQRYAYDRWADREKIPEHPNIARIVEVGEREHHSYVAIEEPSGEPLSEMLKKGPLDVDGAVEILYQIAEALRAAHRRDVVHGHLKPTDIYVARGSGDKPQVKVLFVDMGTGAGDSMLSLFGEVRGVPKYMAPEVIRGRMPGPESDVFALGVIGYELLTGKEPFPSEHPVGYLFANCEKELEPVHKVRSDVPRDLSLIVARCLEKDPERRYRTVQKVVDDLDHYLEMSKTGRVTVVPPGADSAFAREYRIPSLDAPAARQPSRIPVLSVVALVLAVIALVVSAFVSGGLLQGKQGSESARAMQPAGVAKTPKVSTGVTSGPDPVAAVVAREKLAAAVFQGAARDWRERYSLEGLYEMSIAAFRKVAADYSDTPYRDQSLEMASQVYCEWANSLVKKENYTDAEQRYRDAIEIAPEHGTYRTLAMRELPKLMAKRADSCYKRGLYDDALKTYKAIKDEFPASAESSMLAQWEPQLCFEQAVALWTKEGKLAEALEKFQYVLKNYPTSDAAGQCAEKLPSLYVAMAKQRMDKGELADAQKELVRIKQAYAAHSASKEAAALEAQVLYRMFSEARKAGRQPEASSCFAALVSEYPDSEWMRRAMRERVDLAPEPAAVLFDPAMAADKYKKAEQLYEQMQYEAALNALKSVIKFTAPESEYGAKATQNLPEWLYHSALYAYGLQRVDQASKTLKTLADDFGYTPWGKRAETVLAQMKKVPEGMVYVPEGRFPMGLSQDDVATMLTPHYPPNSISNPQELALLMSWAGYVSEVPRHPALTGAFYIDTKEVTNAQYKKFVDAAGHRAPAHWKDGAPAAGDAEKPVVNVSFADAAAYAKWTGKRLPIEMEWEKAARGVDGRLYPWGNVADPNSAHHMRKVDAGPVAVGSYPAGASPYGCLDMIGNVLEWTDSWFVPYEGNDGKDNRAPYGTTYRVLRGGAWYQHDLKPIFTRCTARFPAEPEAPKADIGFRCVKDAQ